MRAVVLVLAVATLLALAQVASHLGGWDRVGLVALGLVLILAVATAPVFRR